MFTFFQHTYHQLSVWVSSGNINTVLIPSFCVLLITEWVVLVFIRKQKWNYIDGFVNIVTGQLTLLKGILFGKLLPVACIVFLYDHCRIFTFPDTWWGLILVCLLYDLVGYASHALGHRTGFFWAFHQVHHSSEEFNPTLSSRFSIFDSLLLSKPLFYLLPVLGVSPVQYIIVGIIESIWGMLQHSRVIRKAPVFDLLFSTPSNHRVHHGVNVKYLDKNYGELFIIWDRIFGTYQIEEEEPRYGLTRNIGTYNIFMIQVSGIRWLLQQMRSASSIGDKLKYLYKPPGWKHDGSGQTVFDLRMRDNERARQSEECAY